MTDILPGCCELTNFKCTHQAPSTNHHCLPHPSFSTDLGFLREWFLWRLGGGGGYQYATVERQLRAIWKTVHSMSVQYAFQIGWETIKFVTHVTDVWNLEVFCRKSWISAMILTRCYFVLILLSLKQFFSEFFAYCTTTSCSWISFQKNIVFSQFISQPPHMKKKNHFCNTCTTCTD
jgi:hypothetical protein